MAEKPKDPSAEAKKEPEAKTPEKGGEKQAAPTREQLLSALTEGERQQIFLEEQEKRRPDVRWRAFHKTRETVRNALGKLVLAGALVIPPLGAALYGVNKVSKATVAKVPFVKYVDEIPRAFVTGGAEKVRNVTANVTALPAAGVDIARGSLNRATKGITYVAAEFYNGLKKAVNHRFKLPEDTNLGASALIGLKWLLLSPLRFAMAYPKTAIATGIIVGGAAYNAGSFLGGLGNLTNFGIDIIKGLMKKIIGTP